MKPVRCFLALCFISIVTLVVGCLRSGDEFEYVEVDPGVVDTLLSKKDSAVGIPASIKTNDSKRLWIKDEASTRILAYDINSGRKLYYGERGRGPGEFQNISGFDIKGNTLSVADAINNRISFFDIKSKDVIGEIKLVDELSWPRDIITVDNNKYILLSLSHQRLDEYYGNRTIHVFKGLKRDTSLFDVKNNNEDNDIHRLLGHLYPGCVSEYGNVIYYAPFLYRSIIYTYDINDNYRMLKYGRNANKKVIEYSDIGSNNEEAVSISYEGKEIRGVINRECIGIHHAYKNVIMVVYSERQENSMNIMVDIFNIRLRNRNSYIISGFGRRVSLKQHSISNSAFAKNTLFLAEPQRARIYALDISSLFSGI